MKKRKAKKAASSDKGSFPGYPRYPAKDDITNRDERLNDDIEDIINENRSQPQEVTDQANRELENSGQGEDEELKKRTTPVDFSGEDLDVPGSELDDDREAIGSEDEENNLYSLGGDNHEDLEERQD
ncbi:MAG TPA: hypothetical protein VFW11_21545 [Cyclobacteriaceae bacterium]|nr:hypothetical protein [Cyclobacteriaceae bacterium]